MKAIPLTRGLEAIVDDEDFETYAGYKWHAASCTNHFYAARRSAGKIVYLHRLICPSGNQVDHVNGDTLDDRRSNLRPCRIQQNRFNQAKRRGSVSPYKGVCFFKPHRLWRARITINRRCFELGYFRDEREAAIAYDRAAVIHFGEFARLNFPENP